MEESRDTKFIDAEDYQSGYDSKLTFKQIVLGHLGRIAFFASKEMRGGYWQDRTKLVSGVSMTEHFYVPDTREEYSNAVNYFSDILSPHFDKQMKQAEGQNNKELDNAYQDSFNKTDDGKKLDTQAYRNKKVEIKRKLFRSLNSFLYRKKYLEIGSIED